MANLVKRGKNIDASAYTRIVKEKTLIEGGTSLTLKNVPKIGFDNSTYLIHKRQSFLKRWNDMGLPSPLQTSLQMSSVINSPPFVLSTIAAPLQSLSIPSPPSPPISYTYQTAPVSTVYPTFTNFSSTFTPIATTSTYKKAGGPSSNFATLLVVDKQGNIYVQPAVCQFMFVTSYATGATTIITPSIITGSNTITAIGYNRSADIFYLASGGSFYTMDKTGICTFYATPSNSNAFPEGGNTQNYLVVDKDGNIYSSKTVGPTTYVASIYKTTPSGVTTIVTSITVTGGIYISGIAINSIGNFLIQLTSGVVMQYSPSTNTQTTLISSSSSMTSTSLLVDLNDNVIFRSNATIYMYNYMGVLTQVTIPKTAAGQNIGYIYGITVDQNGNLVISANYGGDYIFSNIL